LNLSIRSFGVFFEPRCVGIIDQLFEGFLREAAVQFVQNAALDLLPEKKDSKENLINFTFHFSRNQGDQIRPMCDCLLMAFFGKVQK
jgi:hypothetical protein